MIELDDVSLILLLGLVLGVIAFVVAYFSVERIVVPRLPLFAAAERHDTMYQVITRLLDSTQMPEDKVRFIADNGDWNKEPLFSLSIEALVKQGMSGEIRLKRPDKEAIDWYEKHNINYVGQFQSAQDLKAMIIDGKLAMLVVKKEGKYLKVETSDKGLIQRLNELYDDHSPIKDEEFTQRVEVMIAQAQKMKK